MAGFRRLEPDDKVLRLENIVTGFGNAEWRWFDATARAWGIGFVSFLIVYATLYCLTSSFLLQLFFVIPSLVVAVISARKINRICYPDRPVAYWAFTAIRHLIWFLKVRRASPVVTYEIVPGMLEESPAS